VGWVIGFWFWVGFSLGTYCRIWLGPPIHFILIYQIHFIHIDIVCHALYVVGGLKGATPYHTITLKWVVGFWVGLSLGTCCRIWLGPPIHFILIPDSLHTYRKCLEAFNYGWQSYCNNTIPYITLKGGGLGRSFWVDISLSQFSIKIWTWICFFNAAIYFAVTPGSFVINRRAVGRTTSGGLKPMMSVVLKSICQQVGGPAPKMSFQMALKWFLSDQTYSS
jgi:hypothetical protein